MLKDKAGNEIKPGQRCWVDGVTTPGHEQPGYEGKVFSVLVGSVIVEGDSGRGSSRLEWPHHLTVRGE